MNEAQEQDCREAVLAYYCLWRHAGTEGWTRQDLDQFVEKDLERRADLQIDFDENGCLSRLVKLGLVEEEGEHFRARPLPEALAMLEERWRGYFSHVPFAAPAP